MTLPRGAQLTLGAGSAVLLGGVLGLGWWGWRHRPGHTPAARIGRVRAALVALGLLIIAVGAVWRAADAIRPVADCSPPGGKLPAHSSGRLSASLVSQEVATWPETGIGLLYSRASDALVCWSVSANYYVAVHDDSPGGARAMTVGDIVLTPRFDISRRERALLAAHEARHRIQWAIGTAIGGPLAFPVAYAVDDFFYPGSRNHFERMAGLEAGGYVGSDTTPVLGPAQLAAFAALAAVIVFALVVAVRRRASPRSRTDRPI